MTDLNAQGSGPVRIASDKLRWDLRVYCKVHGILGVGRDSNGEFSMTAFCPDCGSDKTTETFRPVATLQAKADGLAEAVKLALRALADDWRPIAEAPRDGTRVLILTTEGFVVDVFSELDIWRESNRRNHGFAERSLTHFKPLPQPPREGTCPECKGKKWVPETFRNEAGYQDHERITCPACKGTGKASEGGKP